jgi:hypothetical protein
VGRNQAYAAYDASQQLDELVRVGSNIDPKSGRVAPDNALSNAMKEEVKKSEIPAVQRKAAQPQGDWKVSTGDLKKENPTNKEWLANRAKEVGIAEGSFSNYSDVDAEIMNMLQSSSDAFGDQEETLVEISRYLRDQGLDNDEVLSIMDSIENYLHDEDMRDNMDDGEPHGSDDMSDDADALASAGHGSDEDYGDYGDYDPMDENTDGIIDKAKNDVGIDDLFDEVDEIVDDEDYDDTCRTCDGTGEGMYDGASCRSCGGSGVEKRERDPDDFDEPDDYFEPYDGPFEEAIDLNNGYGGTKGDGQDYFPDGADGPVVKNAGPSGARYGDNPEQKKMQVAEVHKELVYGYRDYLKESSKK